MKYKPRKERDVVQDNPYQSMLGVMGGEAGRGFLPLVRTGVVASLAPLTVDAGGLPLTGEDLLINPMLLARDRMVSADQITGAADLSVPGGAGASIANGAVTMTAHLPGELAVGDRVAMITADGEQFIILCKGVSV